MMFKIANNRLSLYACGMLLLMALLVIAHIQSPRLDAYAVAPQLPQLTISLPAGGAQVAGHVGTKVHLSGSGFIPGSVNLYTTTSNDPTKCTNVGNPALFGLTPFTPDTATAQNDGMLTVDTTWPASASATGSAYYICAAESPTVKALSSNTFTVAPPPTVTVSPTSVAAGQAVTITGANWLPPQTVTVAITFSNTAAVVVSDHALPDQNGNLTATLTIPATTPAETYSVSVIADNEPTLRVIESNAVTVTAAMPTATAIPPASPTATAAATMTPTPTPSVGVATMTPTAAATPTQQGSTNPSSGNTNSTSTFLLFILGGLGILLVVVGIILFILYSRGR